MYQAVAWRLAFEFLNMKRAIFSPNEVGETVQYFAFGGNLDPAVLKRRKIYPLDEKPFVLKDFALRFSHPTAFEGMGFASIEKVSGENVYGKLYRLSLVDASRMDYYELVPFLGRYKRVEVDQDGEKFYFYQSQDPRPGLKPSKTYLESIIKGFEKADHIPKSYLSKLKTLEATVPKEPAKNLNFLVKTHSWLPENINEVLRSMDRKAAQLFVKHIRDKSWTERYIREK